MELHFPTIEIIEESDIYTICLLDITHFPLEYNAESYASIPSLKRRKEKAASDYMIRSFLKNENAQIENKDGGKPFCILYDGEISISHSANYVVMQLSKEFNCGIDIQIIEERIIRLADKFMNPAEMKVLDQIPLDKHAEYITKCWCIKEVVYKTLGAGFHDYHYGFRIRAFKPEDSIILCDVETENISDTYRCKIQLYQNFVLAYRIGRLIS